MLYAVDMVSSIVDTVYIVMWLKLLIEFVDINYMVDEAQGADWANGADRADGTDETDVAEMAIRMHERTILFGP